MKLSCPGIFAALSAIIAGAPLIGAAAPKSDADLREREAEYYRLVDVPMPAGVQFESGAMQFLGRDKLACATRIGDVWIGDGVLGEPPQPKWKLFASGLHEVLGL